MKTEKMFAQTANAALRPSPAVTDLAFSHVQQGLDLQMVDVRTQQAQTHTGVVPESLSLSILLQGRVDLRMDNASTCFGVLNDGGRRPVPQATLFRTAQPIEFARDLQAGMRLRHLSILAAPDWLDRSGFASCNFVLGGMGGPGRPRMAAWTPSEHVIALSEQLLRSGQQQSWLARLHRESQVLELLAQALQALGEPPPTPPSLNSRTLRRLHLVREKLDSDLGQTPSIEGIACEFGMSADTLQRQFRAAFGTTVFGYLYEARMQAAHRALLAGSPVSVAAYAAGYGSPANFSTAFKRRFGVAPKQVRIKL